MGGRSICSSTSSPAASSARRALTSGERSTSTPNLSRATGGASWRTSSRTRTGTVSRRPQRGSARSPAVKRKPSSDLVCAIITILSAGFALTVPFAATTPPPRGGRRRRRRAWSSSMNSTSGRRRSSRSSRHPAHSNRCPDCAWRSSRLTTTPGPPSSTNSSRRRHSSTSSPATRPTRSERSSRRSCVTRSPTAGHSGRPRSAGGPSSCLRLSPRSQSSQGCLRQRWCLPRHRSPGCGRTTPSGSTTSTGQAWCFGGRVRVRCCPIPLLIAGSCGTRSSVSRLQGQQPFYPPTSSVDRVREKTRI